MAELDAFLEEALAKRFQDGTWDCALMVAAWVERVTGVDGAAPWRGQYDTRTGWLRILQREGGIEGVIAKGAALAGMVETDEPIRGDIGVIDFGQGPMGGIYLGQSWAAAGFRGLAVQRATVVKAWRFSCPQR
jgi:hypothetical protein